MVSSSQRQPESTRLRPWRVVHGYLTVAACSRWKGVEAEQLIADMDQDDMREALQEVGIAAKQGSTAASMREALKAHYKGKDFTPRAVFDLLDEDSSGFLDRDELEKASSMLSSKLGYVMSSDEQEKLFSRLV